MITSKYKSERAIRNGLKRGSMQVVDDYLEVKCSCCNDFFPCDLEFFHYLDRKNHKLNSRCKACYVDNRN